MARAKEFEPDYVGFDIGDEFVVGYGLDYQERYRNLPYIGVLKREVFTNPASHGLSHVQSPRTTRSKPFPAHYRRTNSVPIPRKSRSFAPTSSDSTSSKPKRVWRHPVRRKHGIDDDQGDQSPNHRDPTWRMVNSTGRKSRPAASAPVRKCLGRTLVKAAAESA
jgi:hypothetical protein